MKCLVLTRIILVFSFLQAPELKDFMGEMSVVVLNLKSIPPADPVLLQLLTSAPTDQIFDIAHSSVIQCKANWCKMFFFVSKMHRGRWEITACICTLFYTEIYESFPIVVLKYICCFILIFVLSLKHHIHRSSKLFEINTCFGILWIFHIKLQWYASINYRGIVWITYPCWYMMRLKLPDQNDSDVHIYCFQILLTNYPYHQACTFQLL